ncbi:hypothetical protein L218DRAFT_950218 [Marasmius fiardii PR-910]|nr:hypothetical protein L218DRAFT_950218 [Marasmius fiardii PR-910]
MKKTQFSDVRDVVSIVDSAQNWPMPVMSLSQKSSESQKPNTSRSCIGINARERKEGRREQWRTIEQDKLQTSAMKPKCDASAESKSTSIHTTDNEEEIDELDADDEVLGGDSMITQETPTVDPLTSTTVHHFASPTLGTLTLLQHQLEDATTDLRFRWKMD